MSAIYKREYYLNKIRGFYKSDLIKVITGIRRCGKSCFLLSVIEDLRAHGVDEKDIIYINLDKRGYQSVTHPEELDNIISEKITDTDFKYIFVDEIQNVEGFETIINAFREEGNCSIFLTGSNSYLLSGELVSKLTGRYIEIEMFTLSFSEFLGMKQFLGIPTSGNKLEEFTEYISFGGFPKTLEFTDTQDKLTYITNVIEQIMHKDIIRHKKIRNRSVFEKVKTYIINNFGSTTSLTNILDYFNRIEHINLKLETLNSYIEILENAKIVYKCPRFDVKSKASLRGEQKYYLADLGIYFATNVDARINYGPVLENVLYTYLKAKNYRISVGKIGRLECDFIARKNTDYFYAQVAMTIMEKPTEDREYEPYKYIRDNYPKYLFTLDNLLQKRDGVIHANIIDFTSQDKEL